MSNSYPPKLRPNVAAILRNAEGQILICERMNPAGAWQFPQGGVRRGESDEQALARELREEIGLLPESYIILESRGPYRYLFEKRRRGYCGQEQRYFLLELTGSPELIDVSTEEREFRAARWIDPAEFRPEWLPGFKKAVYQAVFRDFFDLNW